MRQAKTTMYLQDGYSEVPCGKIATVVTCLEMLAAVPPRAERMDPPWRLRRVGSPAIAWYRDLFAHVGAEWLWFSRLTMPAESLETLLRSPAVEVYALSMNGRDEGLLELDFREPANCELAYFGLTNALLGQGAGRWLMNRALEYAWAHPIDRMWVHTCTLDHPNALAFYLRSGFNAYARRIEIADDPRLSGLAPSTAASHVPIIEAPRRA
jgi:GNAT superfamily N-acetyltransferase